MKAFPPILGILATTLMGLVPAFAQGEAPKPPTASPEPGYFVEDMVVTLEPSTGNGVIYYDIDGTGAFSWADAKPYLEPIEVARSMVIRAQSLIGVGGGESEVGTYSYFKDRAPIVALSSPANNALLRRDAHVTLTSTASDPDAHAVTVTYQFYEATNPTWQNIPGAGSGLNHTLSWTPTVAGAHRLRAIATDPYGMQTLSTEVNVTVTPPNQAPMVTMTNPAPNAVYVTGQAIPIAVNANDQDDAGGGITRIDLYHNDTLITTLFPPNNTFNWTNAAVGTHTLQAKALDNNIPAAMGVSTPFNITVRSPNRKPAVTLASSAPGPFTEPAAFQLTASPIDTDGAISAVAFFRNGVQISKLTAPPWQLPVVGLAAGTYAYTARAFDNHTPVPDSTTSAAVNISVGAHLPPTVTVSKDTSLVLPINTVVLRAQASDPEGTPVAYAWTAPAGATLSSTSSATPTATLSGGVGQSPYTFNLTVSDAGTPAKIATARVIVTLTAKPAITSSLAQTATVGATYNYTITSTGSTPVTYASTGRPAWLTQNNAVLSGTPPTGAGNTHNIVLTATNAAGSDQKTLVLSVREAARITQDLQDSVIEQERRRVVLSVSAVGTPTPTFQWQLLPAGGGAPVAVGGNSATLVFDTVAVTASGTYRVIVSNAVNPPDTSKHCRLVVKALLRMQTQPALQEVLVGRRASFRAKATGAGPILYQWFRGNASLGAAAAKDSNLVLDPVALNQAGLYRARITNPFSDTAIASTYLWTDTARLVVNQPKVDRPKADPVAPGDFGINGLTVTLTTDTPSTAIRYTLNGADPTTESSGMAYNPTEKIKLTGATAVIRARAFRGSYITSDLFTGTYTYVEPDKAAKPTAKPAKATFTTTLLCTLATSTGGAKIKYTLDRRDPKAFGVEYTAPVSLNATTTVTAYAYAGNFKDSDTLQKTYTLEIPVPRAPAPVPVPPGKSFTLSQSVSFTTTLDSAVIRYTTDGTSPDSSPTALTIERNVPLPPFTRTTVLKARITRNKYDPSETIVQTYTLLPGPIEATPSPVGGSATFADTQRVTLKVTPADAQVYYTLNDSIPLDDLNRPTADAKLYVASQGIVLNSTYTITAMALANGLASEVFRFSYTKQGGPLPTPQVTTSNNSYSFRDTLRIALQGRAGAAIRFTRDGSDPTASSELYTQPITIDSSMTLQAIALQNLFQPSRILVARFTLVADTLEASPPGGAHFTLPTVTLKVKSAKTPVWYTTDGSIPAPGSGTSTLYRAPVFIPGTTVLKAVAFSGGVPGPLLEQEYRIHGTARDTTLRPGDTFFLDGGLTISNPSDQASAVRVQQGAPDSRFLAGFQQVLFSLIFSPAEGSSEGFPDLVLSRTSNMDRSLYRLMPDGKVYFISAGSQVRISEPGTYFTGIDNELPVITYVGETINDSGYTAVRFKVTDNIQNLLYSTLRNDNPVLNANLMPTLSGSELDFKLKHAAGVLKPLYIQLTVRDFTNLAHFPPDGQSFQPLSQDMLNIEGPTTWRIGGNKDLPHDLVGIPLDAKPALTLGDLRDSQNGRVEALVYQTTSANWRRLSQSDALVPGQAYWLGAGAALKQFSRKNLRTSALGMARFKVKLVHGWNQVSNPHLETLYWPYARTLGDYYRAAPIKGLWAYAPEKSPPFSEVDSLKPWQGYYVYNHLMKDTVIELLSKALSKPVQKKEGAAFEASLTFGYGNAALVQLGASPGSRDALGWEDEGALPGMSSQRRFVALRQGRNLGADWIRLEHDRILQWRILPGPSENAAALLERGPEVRVLSQELPDGYEAWALSRLRGMKFRLQEGVGLPASGLAEDTMLVVAGPAAKLADLSLLKDLSESAPTLGLRVLNRGAGPEMILDLPARSAVRATLWTVAGASLGRLERTLPGGRYHFGLARDLGLSARRPASGLAFLRVEVRGPDGPAYLVRKVVFKD